MIADFKNLFLQPVQARRREAGRRQDRPTVFFGNPDKQAAAAQIVKIVGERAERVQDGFRVPVFFEFQAFSLDRAALQYVIYVQWKRHAPAFLISFVFGISQERRHSKHRFALL